ncbi:S-adenosyl-L-methionine-dependent methyltransferase superfamily protein [Pleurotus pulmonarius]
MFHAASAAQDESKRLDELHDAIATYLDGHLSFAPLEGTCPNNILEVGSGSGAWAIQAATQFPEATVTAIDLSPIPDRPMPYNIKFNQVDLSGSLPFSSQSFDIVHARLIFIHLPDAPAILRRICELVRPGGYLLLEEPDCGGVVDQTTPLGPGFTNFTSTWFRLMNSKGQNLCIGRDLEQIIRSTGFFTEVNVKKVEIPYAPKSEDPRENVLGQAWRLTSERTAKVLLSRFGSEGFTSEMIQRLLSELRDEGRDMRTPLYFTWSRRLS